MCGILQSPSLHSSSMRHKIQSTVVEIRLLAKFYVKIYEW